VNLPARAAALRGDDYQHAIGWWWACKMLSDPNIVSVSIEDSGGGSFDDVVIRRGRGADTYWQVKSSNYGNTHVDENWLFKALGKTARSKSPLQHFYITWEALSGEGREFELALVSNRGFDGNHPILGEMRDLSDGTIRVEALRMAGPSTEFGKARNRWAQHLRISDDRLLEFLSAVALRTEGSESTWRDRASEVMRNVGLRYDDDAVAVGSSLVREWVKNGVGPQDRDALSRQVADMDLLAQSGTLRFAVHAIDRQPSSVAPNAQLDIVELYDGDDPFARYELKNSSDWQARVVPELAEKVRRLEAYGPRRVHVTGSMRLPMWFAVGRALPDVRGWVLSTDQRTEVWSTASPEQADARVLTDRRLGDGPDLAVGIALTTDLTEDVEAWLRASGTPAGHLLVLAPDGDPGFLAVPGGDWAAGWARTARDRVVVTVGRTGATRIHLFMAAPQGAALMLGHQWNMLPATVVYEFVPTRHVYVKTLTLS
jgi:hypothetical protein